MGYINPVVGIHFPGLQVYTCTLFTPCTAVPIQQIKEVREGLAKGSSPKERCFSIIYTEGKKSKTLDLVAHDPADAEAWVQGLMFLLNKDGRSCDQQCCLDSCSKPNQVSSSVGRALVFILELHPLDLKQHN